jgi:hypothetical protein
MMFVLRPTLFMPALLLALVVNADTALAQAYPTRSVRIVIGFAAGGSTDLVGRIVAQRLTEAWGQTVLVDSTARRIRYLPARRGDALCEGDQGGGQLARVGRPACG